MDYIKIIKWLRENGFEVKYSEFFYPNYAFFTKNQTNIIVKEYHDYSVAQQVRSDAVDIRSILNKIGENVWNTYFLICNANNLQLIPYSIEKDSVGVRKYVIRSSDDFKRIPFLDTINLINDEENNNIDIKIYSSQNTHLNKVINYIISADGLQRTLSKEELSEILTDFYDIEEEDDGNED